MKPSNYRQWKVLHYWWDNIEDFSNRWKGLSGIHSVIFPGSPRPIDIYVNEHVHNAEQKAITTFFSGAISSRGNKQGPFFSGIKLSSQNNLPMISIADSSLDDDPELSLAWYTGGAHDNFEANLTTMLNAIADSLKTELILVGGSGGGYASLNYAKRLAKPATVVVWNPQTDIYSYYERFVKAYLKSRFNFAHSTLAQDNWKQYCRPRTDKLVSTNVLVPETINSIRRLVYLQNKTDWHLQKHLSPLWSKISKHPIEPGVHAYTDQHIFAVQDFAEGHNPPDSNLIASILLQLSNTDMKAIDVQLDLAPNSGSQY
ncbi:hypothetical protein [Arthrobacter sp. MYb213]|uniref:hypothetical protein n=1 Tax=Arthrobacter sp. MYb213 TaxID=1848595 RepID=UPI0011B01535|nr:hypothetical protein [Arthrobacter sp. MYb213]